MVAVFLIRVVSLPFPEPLLTSILESDQLFWAYYNHIWRFFKKIYIFSCALEFSNLI